jgi:glycosyltransferase involved in cell wall biosynthesis
VVVTLLARLDRARFRPHLALLEKAGVYLQDVPADVPVHDLRAARVRHALPALIRLIWKLRPRAVLATLTEVNLGLLAAQPFLPRGTKLLVREAVAVSGLLAFDKRSPGIWRWLYRHLYPRADGIICVADFVLDDLAEKLGVPRSKMRRIYNPVDLEGIRGRAAAGANPYAGPGPHLVAAGRLTEQKGVDILLEALGRARQSLPTADLAILGEGPLQAELKALRDRLGLGEVVRFAGFQPNPYPYFQHADLLVLASRYEGLPNVILEALALGTPVVATDCTGGVRELLAPLGAEAGRLAPPEDPERLAEVLIAACAARRNAPRSVTEFQASLRAFNVQAIVREYEEMLAR